MREEDVAAAKILIVDDEPINVRLLERVLATAGYQDVRGITDSRQVLGVFRSFKPDLILLDLMMPHFDGIAVLEQLKPEISADEYLPVVVLTADVALESKHRALAAGAKDFLTKPFDQLEALLRIKNLLDTRRLNLALDAHQRSLEETILDRTQRLLQTEKVATMGSLLAGVAHELNNPLAILTGQAYLLRETAADPAVKRRADKIEQAADRCVRVVRNFLALARQRPPERTDVWVHQVVDGAVELLAYELRSDGVDIAVEIPPGLPTLSADPHQLHQVLVNLIANAHQVLRRRPPPRRIAISARHDAERGRVRLEVADTGPGIPAEIQSRIFEQFFTTKPPGEGTGLGLSLCRGIIEEHGGTIEVESPEGHGATFRLELPVSSQRVGGGERAASQPLPPIQPKVILVVDDEREISSLLGEAFEADGHTVQIAGNGAEALEELAHRSYDLVVTDTKMPILGGEDFYREFERRFPSEHRPRMIFLTGDVLTRAKLEFLEATGAPFLEKPFDLAQVRRLVCEIFSGPEGGGSPPGRG
jgi:signal transduction histidine kinase